MAEEKPVHEQVADLLNSWNKPPDAHNLERALGVRPEEGDTRATVAVRPEDLDHDRNAGSDKIDAERMFADDGDDDDTEDEVSYEDMTKKELQDVIDERNADRDEDDHLSKSGNKAELVARLEEDDAAGEEDEEEDEEEDA